MYGLVSTRVKYLVFLGVNGSGKTTTLKMLTGDTSVTNGNAFIAGESVYNQWKTRKHIGYCMQHNPLFDDLTVRDHLIYYGMIKGIQYGMVPKKIAKMMDELVLHEYVDVKAHALSGGNKRKLCLAIALIGEPLVVLLDEPTTGVDPMAKRHIWSSIQSICDDNKNRSVVLTSHSMEECEALAHRLTIMVDGGLRCIGTKQHLKNKFSHGYIVSISLKNNTNELLNDIHSKLIAKFRAKLLERQQSHVKFSIEEGHKVGDIFSFMETLYPDIEDYGLQQTTIEQIFLQNVGSQHIVY